MPNTAHTPWRASSRPPPIATAAGTMYHLPRYYRPVWHPGHLVYQGGVPFLPPSPVNGGGFFPKQDAYRGNEGAAMQTYATPVSSVVGAGSLPSRPNFLMRLLGGLFSQGQ